MATGLCGRSQTRIVNFNSGENQTKTAVALAGSPSWPECPADQDEDVYRDLCGQAAWSLDKAVKNFLVASWRLRESVVGVLLVKRGVFCRTASTFTARNPFAKADRESSFASLSCQVSQLLAEMGTSDQEGLARIRSAQAGKFLCGILR